MSTERDRLTERRDLVQRDIEELAEQIEEGEVDESTGTQLMKGYKQELGAVEAALAELPDLRSLKAPKSPKTPKPPNVVSTEEATPKGRSMARIVAGSLVVATAMVVVIFLVASNVTPDDQGPSVAASPGELTVDPDSVSNEQLEAVVAANPDIPGMRLALANRYFLADQFPEALDHYLYIAGNNPTPADEALALARIGWIAHATGLSESAEEYMKQSLAIDPNQFDAILFRGFVTLYGLDRPADAIPQLEAALEMPGLPQATSLQVEQALEEARKRLES